MGVSGRPILASALSRESRVTFPGDQLNEAGIAAQTRAAPMEANMPRFFITISRLLTRNQQTSHALGSLTWLDSTFVDEMQKFRRLC
jgi:hypothetical protein